MKIIAITAAFAILTLSCSLVNAQKKDEKKQFARYEYKIPVSEFTSILKQMDSTLTGDLFTKTTPPGKVLSQILMAISSSFVEGSSERKKIDSLRKELGPYLDTSPEKQNKGVVVLRHPVDFSTLFYQGARGDKTDYDSLNNDLANQKSHLANNKAMYRQNSTTISDLLSKGKSDEALKLLALNQALKDQEDQFKQNIEELTALSSAEYNSLYKTIPRYIEDSTRVEKNMLGTTGDDEYFLGNKRIAIVLIGNTTVLSKTKIELANLDKIIKGDFKDMMSLIKSVVPGLGSNISAKDPFSNDGTRAVKLTFLIPVDNKIRSPYEMRIASNKLIDTISVHEKVFFRIKVGFGAGKTDVNYFSLKNNQLVFNPDSTRKSLVKSSLTAMLSFYPFGQDLDHIDSRFYEKVHQRLSLSGGIRISKDPLEALFLGIGFDFQKNFGLFFGGSWYSSTMTNVQTLNTPTNVVGYLQGNGGRGYKGRLFFGLTMSPNAVSGLLGLNKK